MSRFESELVHLLNSFFVENDIRAVAYRIRQSMFTSQVVDVLVDSPLKEYYLAIECKSVSLSTGVKALYFSQHFAKNQIKRMEEFLKLSGRTGVLMVELREGKGKPRRICVVPWKNVMRKVLSKEVGFYIEELQAYPDLKKHIHPRMWYE